MTSPLRDAESATAGVPVVRGLEWSSESPYSVSRNPKLRLFYATEAVWYEESFQYIELSGGNASGRFETVKQAQAAAQADYEQRILSSLNPDFLSELDTARAEIERLRGERTYFSGLAEEQHNIDVAALTTAQARIAELERTVEFVQRWAWRETSATDAERFSVIKYYPGIKPSATLSPVKENDRG